MNVKAVIFDLDGTLLYTVEDLCDSVNYALQKYGYDMISVEQCTKNIGNGVANLIQLSAPQNIDDEKRVLLLKTFKEHYKNNMKNKTVPYDGVKQMLEMLVDKGVKTAVLSNKFDEATKMLCSELLGNLIMLPVGERAGVPRKPAPDAVIEIMSRFGVDKTETVYVGDSDGDILTAKNACVYSIGVTWGYRPVNLLIEAGADAIANTPDDIVKLILK